MYDGEGGKERRVMKIGGSKTVFDGKEIDANVGDDSF